MVLFSRFTTAVAVASAMGSVAGHPGEQHSHAQIKREVQLKNELAGNAARSLAKCAARPEARALKERAIQRRAATAERLRQERGLVERSSYISRRNLTQLEDFETGSHNYTGSINAQDPSVLFSSNTSCILTPENTIGPYFVIGEYVRADVTEGEPGVPMHLEMQFVDTNTCEPVPSVLIDIWNCNSTGYYSGIKASDGQAGLNTTFLRGLQQTNDDGVVEFDTIFPGHYEGRATHTHTVVHVNSTLLPNGSYTGGVVSHIGQIFFDEALRSAVEATSPYNTNTVDVVLNDDDMWAPTQADNNYDPLVDYVYLGDDITDGLLTWISIGIDPTANYTDNASYAAYWDADGGHDSPDTALNVGGS